MNDTIKKQGAGPLRDIPALVRKGILAWLLAVVIEYLLLPGELRDLARLAGLAQMSIVRVAVITCIITALLICLSYLKYMEKVERWGIVGAFGILAVLALCASFTRTFLAVCLLIMAIVTVFAILGWDSRPEPEIKPKKAHKAYLWITVALAVGFFLYIAAWTVARIYCFYTPTYDFGIFAQMFHNMKESGLPMTTLERDGMLSHFDVHVSPIYYLMLPFYCLVPVPATLQVLQAAVLASAVIPLWKIGANHGLSGLQRTLVCAALLLFPAYSGGVSYDLHENCFLTPLILWVFYGIDRKNTVVTAIAAVLTLMVKEDAAVYVAVIGLWLVVRTLLRFRKKDLWHLTMGIALIAAALGWFLATTTYLAESGDGVMTYRYINFMYDGSSSLLTVIKSVVLNPMKAVYECVDAEKLTYISLTLLPLLGLPLLTRRFERYLLLIPYVLINLMSDYVYQHDIMFQYNFGSAAFLVYLTVINLADIKIDIVRTTALAAAALVSVTMVGKHVLPVAKTPVKSAIYYYDYYQSIRDALDEIPDDAPVAATAFYTTQLSNREILYDIGYTSLEHILETEYVALSLTMPDEYKKFEKMGDGEGFDNLVSVLERNGYEVHVELEEILVIYRKTK